MKKYRVSEIVGPTIQGEGYHAGRPCMIVRFSGCNFWSGHHSKSPVCPWCDTPQMHQGSEMTLQEIIDEVGKEWVYEDGFGLMLTGGEPLLQVDEETITELLHHFDPSWIDIETNGSIEADWTRDYHAVWVSCSPKTSDVKVFADFYKILCPDKLHLIYDLRRLHSVRDEELPDIYIQPIEPVHIQEAKIREVQYRKNIEGAVEAVIRGGHKLCIQQHKIVNLP